jgi:hypothetical protein
LKKLGYDCKEPIRLYCDNKVVININHDPVQHDRTKHIEIDTHFIKETLRAGLISTPYMKTGKQLDDILTKECLIVFFIQIFASWTSKTS